MELISFLTKFKQLCNAGLKASLQLNCEDRKTLVTLEVALGPLQSTVNSPPAASSTFKQRRKRSPAYFRRQELRRNAVKQPTINDVIIAAVEVADEENSTDLENEADYNEISSDNTNKAETSLHSTTEDEDKEINVRTQLE